MTENTVGSVSTPIGVVGALRELVSALDRRVPHVERAGETRIAGDARMLRREAVARIGELQLAGSDDRLYDYEPVEAAMTTDDGGPPPERGRPIDS